jgi:hypothetical protein
VYNKKIDSKRSSKLKEFLELEILGILLFIKCFTYNTKYNTKAEGYLICLEIKKFQNSRIAAIVPGLVFCFYIFCSAGVNNFYRR